MIYFPGNYWSAAWWVKYWPLRIVVSAWHFTKVLIINITKEVRRDLQR